jgi:lysophospholipase L1-like esterase
LLASLLVAAGSAGVQAQAPAPQGAPAAVPAAVAIPRPTAAELKTAQDSFAKFLASADPATRAVLQKYPGLLEVKPPPPNAAVIPALAPPFEAKHQANLAVAKQGDAELLLMGDSITDFWRNAEGPFAGKPVLDKHFGQWKIANFGIAGDTTQGVLYRLQNGEGKGFSPRAIMLMIGTNNTARNTAAEIAEGVGAVVLELQRDFPQAKILLLGVFPRGRPNDPVRATIADINRSIAKLHDGNKVHYLDIGAQFLDATGTIQPDIMSDLLHPGPKGYEIWAQAVKEPLTKLMASR